MSSAAKHWWTARDLVALKAPGLPGTERGIQIKAAREAWAWQTMPGFGGPRGYHISSLPRPVQEQIARRIARAILPPEPTAAPSAATSKPGASIAGLTGRARTRAETALLILAAFDQYRAATGQPLSTAAAGFAAAWNAGEIAADAETRQARPRLSRNTLLNWFERRHAEGAAALAGKYRGAAQPQGLQADPRVASLLIAIHADKPWLSAPQYLEALATNLPPGASLPSLRAIQRYLVKWKAGNPRLALTIENPDAAKSRYQSALGDAAAGIIRLNQEWQMDASPADAMCRDGRWKISAVIDVASRQARVVLTRQPKAMAHLALLRLFALERGLPERVKTDNGQDYIARAVKLAFAALDIEHHLCRPFTPEGKPFVERFIGTLQHSLFPTLPGFTGHDVAQAQAIRARKRFSERLGAADDESFAVELTGAELQANINAWLERYHNRRHSTLGCSPNEMAARLAAGQVQGQGQPRRPLPEPRQLDICLMPLNSTMPMVGKAGLRVENTLFYADWMGPRAGLPVLVRLDPADMGIVYCYDPATQAFIGEAEAPERLGKSRHSVALVSRARQSRLDREQLRAIKDRKRAVAPTRLVDALTVEQLEHERRQLEQPEAPPAPAQRGSMLRRLQAVAVRPSLAAPPALPPDAAPDAIPAPEAGPQAIADDSQPPFREVDFVAWVLAGHGEQQHRDMVIAEARKSDVFCLLYDITPEILQRLEKAEAQAA